MQESIYVTGMILKQTPVGDYDRRVCILTKEMGKISAFAKGARKAGNKLSAAARPFSFGTFQLFVGKSSYTISEAEIQNYFESLMIDYIGAYYGMYFCEMADYCTRENNDEREVLKLLYQSLKALSAASLPNSLVRCIYEIRILVALGEFPGIPTNQNLQESTLYALSYIQNSPIEKLYTFTVTDSVLKEIQTLAADYQKHFMNKEWKSLEILKTLC